MTPELSVVIPTRRRPRMLRACLESLFMQTEPFDRFEVVVVVDGVDRETVKTLGHLQAPFELRLFTQNHAGAAAARNHGAEHRPHKGPVDGTAVLSTDSLVHPSALSAPRTVPTGRPGRRNLLDRVSDGTGYR